MSQNLLGNADDIDGAACDAVFHHYPQIIVFVVGAVKFHDILTAAIPKDDDLGKTPVTYFLMLLTSSLLFETILMATS